MMLEEAWTVCVSFFSYKRCFCDAAAEGRISLRLLLLLLRLLR